MSRRLVYALAPPLYATVDFAVIVAPALALKAAADRGGMGSSKGLDLVVASMVVGGIHAVVAGIRLRYEERIALRWADVWIAALDSLVVLALAATLLPMAVLWGFADEHAVIADRGLPVGALWVGILLLAIGLSELTGRFVFRWLEPPPQFHPNRPAGPAGRPEPPAYAVDAPPGAGAPSPRSSVG